MGASYFGGSNVSGIAAAPDGSVVVADTTSLKSGVVSYVTNLVPWLTLPVGRRHR
jgi:hypothetical protein